MARTLPRLQPVPPIVLGLVRLCSDAIGRATPGGMAVGTRSERRTAVAWTRHLLAIGSMVLCAPPSLAVTYTIQPDESRVRFEVGHNEYMKPIHGRFQRVTGELDYDAARPQAVALDVVIEAESIDTDNGYRDAHLRSAFFEADRFPEIHFRSTRVFPEEEVVEGSLTMKGVTRSVRLQLSSLREQTDDNGNRVLRCRAEGHLNRRDFGVEEDADRTEGLGKILAHIQEGLDEFIDDEVAIHVSIVARETTRQPLAEDRHAVRD